VVFATFVDVVVMKLVEMGSQLIKFVDASVM
jgi:hypothetical protein